VCVQVWTQTKFSNVPDSVIGACHLGGLGFGPFMSMNGPKMRWLRGICVCRRYIGYRMWVGGGNKSIYCVDTLQKPHVKLQQP
jgi:hypothetical protein